MTNAENCPKNCKHETFHYCATAGTHCDKHCACSCTSCVADRAKPGPVGTSGGKILPGANVIGAGEGPLDM